MQLALQIIFLISLLLTFGAAIIYYFELFNLHRSLETHHPDALASVRSQKLLPMSRFQAAYRVLRGVKGGAFHGTLLSPDTVRILSSASRWLHVAMFSFMTLLFSGLASEFVA